ncbi:hypothetical protein AMTRI_Chr10g229380 [Amborella trichopoda]
MPLSLHLSLSLPPTHYQLTLSFFCPPSLSISLVLSHPFSAHPLSKTSHPSLSLTLILCPIHFQLTLSLSLNQLFYLSLSAQHSSLSLRLSCPNMVLSLSFLPNYLSAPQGSLFGVFWFIPVSLVPGFSGSSQFPLFPVLVSTLSL